MENEKVVKAAAEYARRNDGATYVSGISFIDGANWRISSVWHGMDHVANPDLLLLVRIDNDEYELAFWPKLDGSVDFPTFTFDRWKEWAYVKDLIPGIKNVDNG